MKISIIEDRDGYVLLGREDGRCAVVERRAGRYYNLHSGERASLPCETDVLHLITAEHDWVDETSARKALSSAIERQEELARRLW